MTITLASRTPAQTPTSTLNTGAFTIGYLSMVDALKVLVPVAPALRMPPVLGCVLVTVTAGQVELSTFDFDTAVTVTLPATNTEPGRMLLVHAAFTKLLAAVTKGASKASTARLDVTVSTPDGIALVTANGYDLPLSDLSSVDSFPQLPVTADPSFVVGRIELNALAARVLVAVASNDPARPILEGAKVEFDSMSLTLTATDGFRAATGAIPSTGGALASTVIPAAILSKILPRLTGDQIRLGVEVVHGTEWFTLADATTTVRARTLEGAYPKMDSFWDSTAARTVTLDRAVLLQSATRAAALTAALKAVSGGYGPSVSIAVDSETVTVAPWTGTSNDSRVKAPALPAEVTGETALWYSIFHPAQLIDAIGTMTGAKVTLRLNRPQRPAMFTDDTGFRHLVMPQQLPS